MTLGKRITDAVRANVTTGLSQGSQVRAGVEVKLSDRMSVQGSYDNVERRLELAARQRGRRPAVAARVRVTSTALRLNRRRQGRSIRGRQAAAASAASSAPYRSSRPATHCLWPMSSKMRRCFGFFQVMLSSARWNASAFASGSAGSASNIAKS